MAADLTTTERYVLSELLVSGSIEKSEYREITAFSRTIMNKQLDTLERKGYLEETLYGTT